MTDQQDNRLADAPKIGIIVVQGGVCAKNGWRNEWNTQMERYGVDRAVFFSPLLPPGVQWDPKKHKPAEDAAFAQADYIIIYLGNTYDMSGSGNTLPVYSVCEAWKYLTDEDTRNRTVIIADYKDLDGHPLRQLKSIASDLRTRAEEYGRKNAVFEDVVEAQRFFAQEVAVIASRRIAKLTQTLERIQQSLPNTQS